MPCICRGLLYEEYTFIHTTCQTYTLWSVCIQQKKLIGGEKEKGDEMENRHQENKRKGKEREKKGRTRQNGFSGRKGGYIPRKTKLRHEKTKTNEKINEKQTKKTESIVNHKQESMHPPAPDATIMQQQSQEQYIDSSSGTWSVASLLSFVLVISASTCSYVHILP